MGVFLDGFISRPKEARFTHACQVLTFEMDGGSDYFPYVANLCHKWRVHGQAGMQENLMLNC